MPKYLSPKVPLEYNNNGDLEYISDDLQQIRQKIRMILLTSPGEKIMMPDFGCGIRSYLFESQEIISTITTAGFAEAETRENITEKIKRVIEYQVKTYLRDVSITLINITFEENAMNIYIEYDINGFISDSYEFSVT